MSGETGFNALELGQTLPGKDSQGNLINKQFLGTIKRFDNKNLKTAGSMPVMRSYGAIYGILLRNTSGGILLPKRLALCDQTAGYGVIENASGYTTALYDKPCVAIDPWLHPTQGVADDDIFIGIFRGPTILMTPSSGSDIKASSTVGGALVASDDNNGRITPAAPGDYATAYQAANAVFGSALYVFTNANTDTEQAVLMHCPWFPC